MSYLTVGIMSSNSALINRCIASVSVEITSGAPGDASSAPSWVMAHVWDYAATPGWADAWDSALAGEVEDPGKDAGVITDAMILSRTQQLMIQYPLTDLLVP